MPTTITNTGITFNDSTTLTTSPIPAGTAWFFHQTNSPTGWTKIVTHNDKTLRVVSGSVGSGGNIGVSSAFTSRTPFGRLEYGFEHSGAYSNITTGSDMTLTTGNFGGEIAINGGASPVSPLTSLTLKPHSHPIQFNAHTHDHIARFINLDSMNFSVNYVDVIIATKD